MSTASKYPKWIDELAGKSMMPRPFECKGRMCVTNGAAILYLSNYAESVKPLDSQNNSDRAAKWGELPAGEISYDFRHLKEWAKGSSQFNPWNVCGSLVDRALVNKFIENLPGTCFTANTVKNEEFPKPSLILDGSGWRVIIMAVNDEPRDYGTYRPKLIPRKKAGEK